MEITRPPPVTQYQANMGGVDRAMQHRAKNPVGRPSKKYWKFLMNFILELCLINAFLVYKGTRDVRLPRQRYRLLDFRCDVAEKLIGDYTPKSRAFHKCNRLDRKRSSCKWCPKQGDKRRRDTVYGCAMCNVHLCKGGCFQAYHQHFHLPAGSAITF